MRWLASLSVPHHLSLGYVWFSFHGYILAFTVYSFPKNQTKRRRKEGWKGKVAACRKRSNIRASGVHFYIFLLFSFTFFHLSLSG